MRIYQSAVAAVLLAALSGVLAGCNNSDSVAPVYCDYGDFMTVNEVGYGEIPYAQSTIGGCDPLLDAAYWPDPVPANSAIQINLGVGDTGMGSFSLGINVTLFGTPTIGVYPIIGTGGDGEARVSYIDNVGSTLCGINYYQAGQVGLLVFGDVGGRIEGNYTASNSSDPDCPNISGVFSITRDQ